MHFSTKRSSTRVKFNPLSCSTPAHVASPAREVTGAELDHAFGFTPAEPGQLAGKYVTGDRLAVFVFSKTKHGIAGRERESSTSKYTRAANSCI